MDGPEAKISSRKRVKFVSRRGRPTPEQAAAIDRTILASARKLFLKLGYANTAMEAVAAAAGVSKVTLYARYASKAALFEAVAAERLRAWTTSEFDDFPGDVRANLVARGEAMMAAMRRREIRAFDHLVQSESPRFPEILQAFYERGYLANVRAIAHVLQTAGRPDGASCKDPETIAETFVLAIIGWMRGHLAFREVTADECRARSERVVELVMAARDVW